MTKRCGRCLKDLTRSMVVHTCSPSPWAAEQLSKIQSLESKVAEKDKLLAEAASELQAHERKEKAVMELIQRLRDSRRMAWEQAAVLLEVIYQEAKET